MNNQTNKLAFADEPLLSISYKSPSLLSNVLNTVPDSIIVTDPNFLITGLNVAAETLCNIPASEAVGKNLFEIAPFEIVDSTLGEAITSLFNSDHWSGRILYHRHNGQDVYFETRCTLIYDEGENISSILFINKQVTESAQHAKDLAIAENKYQVLIDTLSDGVLMIDADGTISATNKRAAEIFELTEEHLLSKAAGSHSWKAVKEDGTAASLHEFPAIITLTTGIAQHNIVMGIDLANGKRKWLSLNSKALFKEGAIKPYAAVVSFTDITEIKATNEKLAQSELLFRSFMTNSPMLAWVYDEDGMYVYGNTLFKETLGIKDTDIGKHLREISSPQTVETIINKNNLAIEKGEPILTEDELIDKEGNIRYFLAYWFVLPSENGKKLISGHAIDITEIKKTRKEIELVNERFEHAMKATSEAIWDHDLINNKIYRSDTYYSVTGYTKDQMSPELEWWFERIHPDDRKRVVDKYNIHLDQGTTHWDDEYRFLCADDSYRYLLDKGFTIYENGKAVRQVGSLQDLTERKRLEEQLLKEQILKQRSINLATIEAQERERNIISRELHDNVNQLLMSAKLHIGVAKNSDDNHDEFLNKASDYLMQAVEEIRTLSKQLNSSVLTVVGLQKVIGDIATNMHEFNNIEVDREIDDDVVDKLTSEQQLMVYRIIQEQSNNIIKYAEATKVFIALREKQDNVQLIISDNGKGFEENEDTMKGIGFINITCRVDAFHGEVQLISSPGNGCLLDVTFPYRHEETHRFIL